MSVSDERIERVTLAILARCKSAWVVRDLARAALEADAPTLEAALTQGVWEGLRIGRRHGLGVPLAVIAAHISALRGKVE